ncbi:VC0807 family protein [Paraburkholderia flagellata]|uniref:VC0807 family protein n=1 Tax=Paraburkholderia flagellata TaxID=2883241 RepID=UPI001F27577D|nr:VC0807 family protein [Paraburkholderia flagellata]
MKLRPAFVAELAVNLLLPWVAYRLAEPHWGEVGGLIASAAPPLAWSIVELVRFRRVDALSAVILLGIVLSLLAVAFGGSPRVLLMRESLASGAIGAAFLISLLAKRPLVFYLTRATVARETREGVTRLEQLWNENASFVAAMRLLTFIWGFGLCLDSALRTYLAATWPIERFLVVSPIIGYGVFGGLMAWTFWYRTRMRRIHGTHGLLGDAPATTNTTTLSVD